MKNVLFLMMALTLVSAPALMCEPIKTDAPAYQSKGAVMVPMRAIFEWLGAEVSFDSATGGITAKRGEQIVSLKAGSKTATVNGETKTMSASAESRNGRTFVPVRFVAEAFGAEVGWDQQTNTVIVEAGDRRGTISVDRPLHSAESPAVKTPKAKHVPSSDDIGGILQPDAVDVNGKDTDGYASLHKAARDGNIQRAEQLISQGANITATTNDGLTPLAIALKQGHSDFADMIVSKAPLEKRTAVGMSLPTHTSDKLVGAITLKELGDEGPILMSTTEPDESMHMVGFSVVVATGIGSRVRIMGSMACGSITVSSESNRGICFKRVEPGEWVYLCGKGSVVFDSDSGRQLHFDRSLLACLRSLRSDDPVLVEGALRDIEYVTGENESEYVISKIKPWLESEVEGVSKAAKQALSAIGGVPAALRTETFSYQLHAQHILVGIGEQFNRTEECARRRMQEVQDKLATGGAWDDLAKEYSDDLSKEPVRTVNGLHFIKLAEAKHNLAIKDATERR